MLQVNLKNAAKSASEIAIDLPLSQLTRLHHSLEQQIQLGGQSVEDEVKTLELPNDPRFYGELQFKQCPGTPLVLITGHFTGQVGLRCQACLHLFVHQLDVDIALAYIKSEDQLNLVPEGYEPFVHPTPEATYAELLEDDLLLAIPIFPRHQYGDCESIIPINKEETAVEKKRKPFADLRAMMKPQVQSDE